MKFVFFQIFVMVILLVACEPKEKNYYIQDETLINAMQWEEGSYFIYRDSANNEMDTVVCTKTEYGIYGGYDYTNQYFEQYQLLFTSTMNGKVWMKLRATTSGSNAIESSMILKENSGEVHSVITNLVEKPFTIGSIKSSGYSEVSHKDYYDNLEVEGQIYNDVYEIETKRPDDSVVINSFFSLQSGLVKCRWIVNGKKRTFVLIMSKIYR